MNQQTKPLLTIGMIVKNEIRCIERCLNALEPLRQAIPCELIIADTGSDDGTRETAQRYADQLFDFEWINDFAAARNAVLDRAHGEWFFTIDADEWLDEDISQLTEYLRRPELWGETNMCGITVRNYTTTDLAEGPYDDFLALRIFRRLPGARYVGAIHEMTTLDNLNLYLMPRVVLNHDGYLGLNGKRGEAKRERNLALLREKLAQNPQELLTLQQCIESSGDTPERLTYIRQAVAGVEEHWPNWQVRGPVIFRYAADIAQRHRLPELWDWVKRAEEWFPNSMFTRIEIRSIAFWAAADQQKYAEAIHYGRAYLQAVEDYRAGRYDPAELLRGSLGALNPTEERNARLQLAGVYLEQEEYEAALEMMLSVKIRESSAQQIQAIFGILLNLQARSDLDLAAVTASVWEQLTVPAENGAAEEESRKHANQRRTAALLTAAQAFSAKYREKEEEEGFPRHAYTLFLPLVERCDPGRAAALLECDSLEEIDRYLSEVEDWTTFPAAALACALDQGGSFPVEGKPLPMEVLDALAARLTEAGEDYLPELCGLYAAAGGGRLERRALS